MARTKTGAKPPTEKVAKSGKGEHASNVKGSYRTRKRSVASMELSDLRNPFNFFYLLLAPIGMLVDWLREKLLLRKRPVICTICNKECTLTNQKKKEEGVSGYSYYCYELYCDTIKYKYHL